MKVIIEIISGKARTRGEQGGEVPPALSQKLEKNWRNFWEKLRALIVVIYRVNFSLKVQFLRVSRRKKEKKFFPVGPYFLVVDDCLLKCLNWIYWSALIKLLCPKKFVVMRLLYNPWFLSCQNVWSYWDHINCPREFQKIFFAVYFGKNHEIRR